MAQQFFYTRPQIEKIGNAIIYLSAHVPDLNKTKLLKLIYLIEQLSIQKSGFPFFNIRFDVWKFGPVSRDIFYELSATPDLLNAFIAINKQDDTIATKHGKTFNDDEFSDNDLALLAYVTDTFKDKTATELVNITHNPHSPWYQTAQVHGLLAPFEEGKMNTTDIEIDFTTLFKDAHQKAFYLENKELLAFGQHLKS